MVPFNAYVLLKLFEGTLTERHVCSDLRQSNNTLPDCPPHPSSLPHFSPLSSHLNLVTFLAYFHASILITTVQPEQVGAISSLGSHSKIPFIAAIVVGATLFLLLLVIAAILVRRRQIYGGFYICTTPPLPDMIPRLDSSIPLIEQVHKLPLDKRWEFPREHLRFCKI